jgi:hypothetical protein
MRRSLRELLDRFPDLVGGLLHRIANLAPDVLDVRASFFGDFVASFSTFTSTLWVILATCPASALAGAAGDSALERTADIPSTNAAQSGTEIFLAMVFITGFGQAQLALRSKNFVRL